jgi:hypothetical protein
MNNVLNFPKQETAYLSQLSFTDLNREIDIPHVQSMTHKIKEKGFLDVIKVFPQNNEGTYLVAESQHRVRAIKNIIGNNNDIKVPVAILDWLNPDDVEEVISTITSLNTGTKSWNIYDYVRTNALANRPSSKDYDYILTQLQRNKGIVSNNQVCQVYNGGNIPGDKFREGKEWKLTPINLRYGDIILNEIIDLIKINGKRNFNAMVLRYYIIECFKYQKQLSKNNSDSETLNKFLRFLEVCTSEFIKELSGGTPLPEGGDPMNNFINKQVLSQL